MARQSGAFNLKTCLLTIGCRTPGESVFARGDIADAIFVILKEKVGFRARSHDKKEIWVGIYGGGL